MCLPFLVNGNSFSRRKRCLRRCSLLSTFPNGFVFRSIERSCDALQLFSSGLGESEGLAAHLFPRHMSALRRVLLRSKKPCSTLLERKTLSIYESPAFEESLTAWAFEPRAAVGLVCPTLHKQFSKTFLTLLFYGLDPSKVELTGFHLFRCPPFQEN